MARFSWTKDTLFGGLTAANVAAAMYAKAETEAVKIQSTMQRNRPWTDRTGQAKRQLSAVATKNNTNITVTLTHGVEYGQFLETRWYDRYAIIKPTLTTEAPKLMQAMTKLFTQL